MVFFKNKFVLLTLFILVGTMICTDWAIPVLSDEMWQNHHPPMTKGNAGLSFAIGALAAGIGSPFLGYMCRVLHRKYITAIFGLLVLSAGLLLVGPS